MQYKLLGNTGLKVSEVCLGTMTFGTDWGWGADKTESRKIYEAFREAGGNFVDTANYYTNGTSEKILGELIAPEREKIVLATKYTSSMDDSNLNASGNSRKNMIQAVNASLKRLGVDYIDLYWVHAWDYLTTPEEIMRGLDDLVKQGKILYTGISDTPAWIVSRMQQLALLRGWTPFAGIQIEYSLIERTVERELLPMAKALDLAVLAWSPLGSGILTGKYTSKNKQDKGAGTKRNDVMQLHQMNDRNLAIAEQVVAVAGETGHDASQVALNWLCAKGVIPILGASRPEQLQKNLGSLSFELSEEHIRRLDAISQIDLGFPYDFYPRVLQAIYGAHPELAIRNHRAHYSGLPATLNEQSITAGPVKSWSR
jgi:aryl-alcohol dehydrogenase-like predicted oxidoreductase